MATTQGNYSMSMRLKYYQVFCEVMRNASTALLVRNLPKSTPPNALTESSNVKYTTQHLHLTCCCRTLKCFGLSNLQAQRLARSTLFQLNTTPRFRPLAYTFYSMATVVANTNTFPNTQQTINDIHNLTLLQNTHFNQIKHVQLNLLLSSSLTNTSTLSSTYPTQDYLRRASTSPTQSHLFLTQ